MNDRAGCYPEGTIMGLRKRSDRQLIFRLGGREETRWRMSSKLSKDVNPDVGNFRVYRNVTKPPTWQAACSAEPM
jgi:hypothetical protein